MGDSPGSSEPGLGKRRLCPQCDTWRPQHNFERLPVDLRCNLCMTQKQSTAVKNLIVEEARLKLAQVVDAAESRGNTPSLDKFLTSFVDQFGGVHTYCNLLAAGIKALYENGKIAQAVAAQVNMLRVIAKAEQTRKEEEWRRRSTEELKEEMKLQMAGLMMEMSVKDERMALLAELLLGEGLKKDVVDGIVEQERGLDG